MQPTFATKVTELDEAILESLIFTLHEINSFVGVDKAARERPAEQED